MEINAVLDLEQPEPDSSRNYVEKRYDTNPLAEDSNNDLIEDRYEIAFVQSILVEKGYFVVENQAILWVQTVQDRNYVNMPIKTQIAGWVYHINIEINEEVTSRLQDLVVVLEKNERFTNFNEYNARGRDLDGIVGGRSVDLLNDDSD